VSSPLSYDPWLPIKPGNKPLSSDFTIQQPEDNPVGSDSNDVLIGILLEMEGKIAEAILHYKQMVARNSLPGFALSQLVGIKNRRSIPNIRGYLEALAAGNRPYKPIVLTLLAGMFLNEGNYEQAMFLYDKIIRKYPDIYFAVNALFEKFFAALNYEKDLELAGQLLLELQSLGLTDEEFLIRLAIAENLYNENGSNYLVKSHGINSEGINSNIPKDYSLLGNYPNPFNPTTTISYAIPYQSSIELTIYDIMGREIKTFNISSQPSGYQSIMWDGTNENRYSVSSGIYLYRIRAESLENDKVFIKTSKLMLLR